MLAGPALDVVLVEGSSPGFGSEVGDQRLRSRSRPFEPRQHRRLAYPGHPGEHGFDLAQLDAETAHFHLMVDAPEEVDASVGPPAREVPGAIEARAGRAAANGSGTKTRAVRSGSCR